MREQRRYRSRRGAGKSATAEHRTEVGAIARPDSSATNPQRFFVLVEGVEVDGHVRGANGLRWKVA